MAAYSGFFTYKNEESLMGVSVIDARDHQFWNTDIEQLEKPHLKGVAVTSLDVHQRDDRVPSQGTVLTECVDIDNVVARPSYTAVLMAKFKMAIMG